MIPLPNRVVTDFAEVQQNFEYLESLLNPATSWSALPFHVPWESYGGVWQPVEYMKDENGWVHIRGMAKNKEAYAYGSTIGELPSGFRPEAREPFGCYGKNPEEKGNFVARVDVTNNGVITIEEGVGTNPGQVGSLLVLSGITFYAGT